MKSPNITLPFFAYGLFKPGELSYFQIKEFVKATNKIGIPGILKERDGIPIFQYGNNCKEIKGFVIYFDPDGAEEAYKRIMGIEPKKIYKWDEIRVKDEKVNVLVGKRFDRGSADLEHVYEWKGREDPYFSDALEEVESILEKNSDFSWDYKVLFRLQMAYMLLWTSIERYASLKYSLGDNATHKIEQIADEPIFAESLKQNVKNSRTIFKASNPKTSYTLDPENPIDSIRYYYQVRSNTVHRGKAVVRDFETIKLSIMELLAIFRDILEYSWKNKLY